MINYKIKIVGTTMFVMFDSKHTLENVRAWFNNIKTDDIIEMDHPYDVFLHFIHLDELLNIKFYDDNYLYVFIDSIWDKAKGIMAKSKFSKYLDGYKTPIKHFEKINNSSYVENVELNEELKTIIKKIYNNG